MFSENFMRDFFGLRRDTKPVQIKREWTSDGQGNVLTITVSVSFEEIAEWTKAVKFVPSYFKTAKTDVTQPGCLVFEFKRSAVGKDGGR